MRKRGRETWKRVLSYVVGIVFSVEQMAWGMDLRDFVKGEGLMPIGNRWDGGVEVRQRQGVESAQDPGVETGSEEAGSGAMELSAGANSTFRERIGSLDVTGDGIIDLRDLVKVGQAVGRGKWERESDVNQDGVVNEEDLRLVGSEMVGMTDKPVTSISGESDPRFPKQYNRQMMDDEEVGGEEIVLSDGRVVSAESGIDGVREKVVQVDSQGRLVSGYVRSQKSMYYSYQMVDEFEQGELVARWTHGWGEYPGWMKIEFGDSRSVSVDARELYSAVEEVKFGIIATQIEWEGSGEGAKLIGVEFDLGNGESGQWDLRGSDGMVSGSRVILRQGGGWIEGVYGEDGRLS